MEACAVSNACYAIEILEHDGGPPWTDDIGRSRDGAWKRIKQAASQIVESWPHPIWFKVWRVARTKDGQKSRVLVYTGDLRHIKSNT